MSADCIFCQIVDGEIPSYQVYEDDDVLGFLDANPLRRGHTLLIPKAHHETMDDLPTDLGAAIGGAATQVAPAVEEAVDADATTVAFNNGEAAGQEVPHVHCHVIPRSEGDGVGPVHALFSDRPDVEDDELEEIAGQIEALAGKGGEL